MALEGHIEHLSNQHRKIQDIIEAEMANPDWDEIRVAALKKQKLRIKDELERLKMLQRVQAISPTPETVAALVARGVHSAQSVAQVPYDHFVRQMSGALGPAVAARPDVGPQAPGAARAAARKA